MRVFTDMYKIALGLSALLKCTSSEVRLKKRDYKIDIYLDESKTRKARNF